ncbi:substrate-binding domain-containing protein [Rhodoferax sediminis]|uniref:LysR family transcriptional regulator n=1 Tax=Rhodoferax sediminis TaxID=2509614 RepID=A0A515D9A2_9BURK|nr:LysR family transcriptional regulator [Rhodoferax sediminis]
MHRLQFHYTLGREHGAGRDAISGPALIRNPLIDLLQAVAAHGSISAAARGLGLSYRHVWGELKRWESELGNELIIWEKGQPAQLSEFGTKLMWSERQAQARLAPQIEALRSDLERAFAVAFDDSAHVLTFYASHDTALATLRDYARSQEAARGPLHLDMRFTGSVDAIRALNEGRCMMAGFHTQLQPGAHSLAERTYKPLLQPGLHKIIGFAQRTQGLMVAPGNPQGLTSLQDLQRTGARFVNRALGTGTRVVLDELLAQARLTPADIAGYEHTEPSHAAVAHAVAAGQADAGLGIEVAARARGLGFVPLVQERYHLVCLKSALAQPGPQALLQLLRSASWQTQLNAIAGYRAAQSGEVLSMREVLPWWDYRRPKARPRAGG